MSTPRQPNPAGGIQPAALRGAVDLGALAKAREAKEARAAGGPGASYVIDVTTAGFQSEVLEQSMTTPVVLDLWAEWCGPCKTLSPILERLAVEYAGRFLLAKVDVDAEQQIAAAFQVQSIPSVFAVLKGQPIPLFQGALPEPQIRQFLDELLTVAAENGVTGTVAGGPQQAVDDDAQAVPEADGDARLDAAADAIEAGDWAAAEEAYRAILADDPTDADAKAGLTIVALQARLTGVDPAAARRAADDDPTDAAKAVVAADVEVSEGDAPAAYARLIAVIKAGDPDGRNQARARLLELFDMAPADDPAVASARRALAAALF